VGQHSEATKGFYDDSKFCGMWDEAKELMVELESIGYFIVEVPDVPEDFSWSEIKP